MTEPTLDAATATRFAALALDNIVREYPNHPQHVWRDGSDARTPRELHPAFFGSYDWHSCVHMHWLLARIRRLHPGVRQRAAIAARFDEHFATEAIAAECAYLARPQTQSFERTYGWAWLLKLVEEVGRGDDDDCRRWYRQLQPLTDAIVARYVHYLPRARYPLRYGIHANSAFGLGFALDYARDAEDWPLEALIVTKALAWYATDRDAPADWEPSGSDFLSPALMEAELMRRVLPAPAYAAWLAGFLPGLASGAPSALFSPAEVADRSDPQIVHLDGLNLSRAWCFRGIAAALPDGDHRTPMLLDAAERHLAAGLAGIGSGEFVGEHWLATFAALALCA